ncbi:hypothetical protein AbraIFM66950_002652 [Aspergillus brasiliensis]|nr:hypothetical protein AbraIFM66950_002652 [Aspergillus brasiliensis]
MAERRAQLDPLLELRSTAHNGSPSLQSQPFATAVGGGSRAELKDHAMDYPHQDLKIEDSRGIHYPASRKLRVQQIGHLQLSQ